MKGYIILNLAMSIDGYIADEAGGYDWIVGDGSKALDTVHQEQFPEFLASIDVILMGRNCYDQNMHAEFQNHKILVATHDRPDHNPHENVEFIQGDLVKQVLDLKNQGKRIYLFGGGKVIEPFLTADAIDEYMIGIIPVVLGKGRPLFTSTHDALPMKLTSYSISEGVVIMRYIRREHK